MRKVLDELTTLFVSTATLEGRRIKVREFGLEEGEARSLTRRLSTYGRGNFLTCADHDGEEEVQNIRINLNDV